MSVAPEDKKCSEFADYLTETYITKESLFPPLLWAEVLSDSRRTNNGPESFHSHFNEQFYYSHPSIYVFLDEITKIQMTTYIKIRNINETAPMSRLEREKSDYLMDFYQKYADGEECRSRFTRTLAFKYQARTGM